MFTFCCLSYWFDVFFFNNFFHSSSQYVSAGDNNVCVPPFDPFFPDLADFDFGPNCPAIVRRRRRPCVHLCLHPTKRTLPPIVHRSFTYATFRCRCSPLDALPSAPFPTPPFGNFFFVVVFSSFSPSIHPTLLVSPFSVLLLRGGGDGCWGARSVAILN